MTIQKYTTGIELKVDQWVCCLGNMRWSFAGRPSIIREVKKSTVAVEISHRIRGSTDIDWEKKTIRNSSIVWVCDTEDEAIQLFDGSRKFTEFAIITALGLT